MSFFLSPSTNRYRTKDLFAEFTLTEERNGCPFYYSDIPPKGLDTNTSCLPLKKLFVDVHEDVTEYSFAQAVFGSYEHWQHLCSLDWFKPVVKQYRLELGLKLKHRAIRQMFDKADGGDFAAQKFIATKGWKRDTESHKEQDIREVEKRTSSKKQIESKKEEQERLVREQAQTKLDAERIGLTLVSDNSSKG